MRLTVIDIFEKASLAKLKTCAKRLKIKGFSTKKKDDLLTMIQERFSEDGCMEAIIEKITYREFNFLKKLMKKDGVKANCEIEVLLSMGIVSNDGDKYSLSQEAYDLFKAKRLDNYQKEVSANHRRLTLVKAYINFLGLVSEDELVEAFMIYEGYSKSEASAQVKFVKSLEMFETYNNYFVQDDLYASGVTSIERVLLNINGVKAKQLSYDELLKYSDPYYFERCDAHTKLETLLKLKNIEASKIDDFFKELVVMYRVGDITTAKIVDLFIKYGCLQSQLDMQVMCDWVNVMYNNTVVYHNHGYTPNEKMMNFERK